MEKAKIMNWTLKKLVVTLFILGSSHCLVLSQQNKFIEHRVVSQFFFENTSREDFPVFSASIRFVDAIKQVSLIEEGMKVNVPSAELLDFKNKQGSEAKELFSTEDLKKCFDKVLSNQWEMVDYKENDDLDLEAVLGIDERAGSNKTMLLTTNRSWEILPLSGRSCKLYFQGIFKRA